MKKQKKERTQLGTRIHKYLVENDLTGTDFCKILKISNTYLYRIMYTGTYEEVPSDRVLFKIQKLLGEI